MRASIALLCGVLLTAVAGAATMEEAQQLFTDKKWGEAAAAYQEIAGREPGNALAQIRVARSHAASGNATGALSALQAWFATGSGSYQTAMTLPEFQPLHDDPRFIAMMEPLKPCQSPEFRQFDFWLGDWNVESPASPGSVSRNQITSINDGCTIHESYATPTGYEGTSLNFYDAARKVWHQTWIDNQGGALFIEGGLQGNAMVLSTTNDPQAVSRITWTPLDDGRVRQHWETTADGGKTWATAFDGYYSRRAGD
jgi:hypothetical protein